MSQLRGFRNRIAHYSGVSLSCRVIGGIDAHLSLWSWQSRSLLKVIVHGDGHAWWLFCLLVQIAQFSDCGGLRLRVLVWRTVITGDGSFSNGSVLEIRH
jgi:hypothetical protein